MCPRRPSPGARAVPVAVRGVRGAGARRCRRHPQRVRSSQKKPLGGRQELLEAGGPRGSGERGEAGACGQPPPPRGVPGTPLCPRGMAGGGWRGRGGRPPAVPPLCSAGPRAGAGPYLPGEEELGLLHGALPALPAPAPAREVSGGAGGTPRLPPLPPVSPFIPRGSAARPVPTRCRGRGGPGGTGGYRGCPGGRRGNHLRAAAAAAEGLSAGSAVLMSLRILFILYRALFDV